MACFGLPWNKQHFCWLVGNRTAVVSHQRWSLSGFLVEHPAG